MRLIDADELMEHVWRDKLDSRELIAKMINDRPTVKDIPINIPINIFEQLISQGEKCCYEKNKLGKNALCIKVDGDIAIITKEIFQECYEKWIKPDDLISKKELIGYIDKAIEATNMDTTYEAGMRNGLRFVKSLITDEKPEYE